MTENNSNIDLPIKKTDGNTLKERMSENAYERILPARYLMKNPEGETVETQEELFERVAKNIALADALYEAQRLGKTIKITPKNIKDNHSKRDKLVEKVFGEKLSPEKAEEKELETTLTEHNVKHLSYDNLLPDLPDEIAKHVENVKENYQEQMENLKLMPNSPALMNAGDELQQMSACFVISPDDDMEDIHDKSKQASKIFQCLTENHYVYEKEKGLVQVKDINKGDEVVQGSTFEKVKDTFSYEDSPVIEVELSNGITIEGTPNHKILVDDSWKKLENIDEGETIDLEINWIPERSRTIKLEKVEKGGNWNRKYSNQEILKEYNKGKSDYEIAETLGAGSSTIQRRRVQELELPPNGQGGRSKQMERSVVNKIEKLHKKGLTNGEIAEKIEELSKNSVNRIIKNIGKTSNGNPVKEVSQPDILSEELSELVGLWVGDGSIHQDGIRFHIKRDKTKDRICEIVKNQFDTKADYIKDEENYEIIIHSNEIKRWFLKNFGEGKKEGSTNAQVPGKILKSDRKNIESFLKGLFTADGSNSAGKKVYPQLTTSSEKLAEQVQTLLFGLGIPAERKEFHRDNDYESAKFIRARSEKGRKRFYNNIGFIYENNKEKVEKINNMNTNLNEENCLKTEITSINDKEKQKDVYDIKIRNKPVYTVNSITSHNSGGGCGYGFWKLRPKGDKVGSSGGVSSGPLSFMRTYDQVCSTVAQGGKRRGAQMGVMRVTHPDIIEFIHSKRKAVSLAHTLKLNDPDDFTHNSFREALEEARELINEEGKVPEHLRNAMEGHLSNFNISVGITDDFMDAVYNDEEFTFTNPRTGEDFIANEETVEMYDMFGLGEYVEEGEVLSVPAKEIWDHIIEGAHENGEPGVVFLERMNKEIAFDPEEHPEKRVYATNPCGEQELFDYDACNLKHINLSTILDNDCSVQDYREFSDGLEDKDVKEVVGEYLDQVVDWDDLDERVHWGTRFLDNVVTMSDFPVDKIEDVTRENRKIGLGVMGYAQMLVQMGVEYGSEEANEIARQLMNYINDESVRVSKDLAVNDEEPGMSRGVFEDWDKSKWSNPVEYKTWFEEEYTDGVAEEWEDGFPVRNHSNTTVAPTGCVLEGSTVSTPEGLVKINDFVDRDSDGKWNSISEDVCSDDGVVSATNGFENGESDIRRITTEKGFEVSSTEDHKFRVINEDGEYVWKRADEIDVSDSLVLRKGTTSVEDSNVELDTSEKDNFHHNTDDSLVLPEKLTPELSEFLGFYVGDGYVHDEKSVNIAVNSEKDELFNYIMDLSKEVFGVTPTVEDKGHVKMICVGGRHITRYFKDNGWRKERGNNGEGSANARVPSQVMRGGSSNMKSFIKGFVEADGTASRKVEMFSSSEDLLKDIQNMLLSLGIVFKREKKQISEEAMSKRFGERDMYILRGLNKNEDKKFVDDIGFVTKSLDLDVDVNSYEGDDYPGELIDQLRDMDGYYDVNDSLRSCLDNARNYGHISKITLDRFFENDNVEVDEDSLVYKLYSDFFVDDVSGVEEDTGYTLDLEVPKNRTYIANGFVSHNTTSMIGNTSGGCEPIYSVANFKNVTADIQGEDMLVQFDDFFLRVLEANDVDVEAVKEEAKSQMNSNEFDGVEGLETVPDKLGELFVTTSDLSAIEHASVQCAFQEGVSSSISKTVNAPNEATLDDTREAFEYVYDNGGKGVTYYRDGTRAKQVLTTRRDNQEFADEGDLLEAVRNMVVEDDEGEEFVEDLVSMLVELEDEEEFVLEELAGGLGSEVREFADDKNIGVSDSNLGLSEYRKRPDNLVGATVRVNTGYGTLYVTLNEDENGELFEVFAEIGKSGGLKSSFTEGISRMVSMSLRYGVPPERIMKHLSGIKSAKTNWDNGDTVHSVPDGISLALERYLNAGGVVGLLKEQRDGLGDDIDEEENDEVSVSRDLDIDEEECPECNNTDLDYGEGCLKCHECGWSKC